MVDKEQIKILVQNYVLDQIASMSPSDVYKMFLDMGQYTCPICRGTINLNFPYHICNGAEG